MKTAVLITARLKSQRLPRKALMEVAGKPLVAHLTRRLRQVKSASEIILCTSPLPEDDALADFAVDEGIACFRSEPEDVLMRLSQAAETFELDTIISCTADNPFVDPAYLDRLHQFHRLHSNDYSKSYGLPFGTFGYLVNATALKRACWIKTVTDTEVWGGYFTETGSFRWGVMEVQDENVRWPELRLTVDTPQDFELTQRLIAALEDDGQIASLEKIVEWCRQHPEAVALNAHIQQRDAPAIGYQNR